MALIFKEIPKTIENGNITVKRPGWLRRNLEITIDQTLTSASYEIDVVEINFSVAKNGDLKRATQESYSKNELGETTKGYSRSSLSEAELIVLLATLGFIIETAPVKN